MNRNWELIISGSGGQGAILAGIIFAAAALDDGYNVIQTQSYGPEARGGASRSEVLISWEELAYPEVQNCNLMVCLTQESLNKYGSLLIPGGILIVDQQADLSSVSEDIQIYRANIFDTVQELGNPLVANVLVLGIVNGITDIVSWDVLTATIKNRVPAHTVAVNLDALERGKNIGEYLVSTNKIFQGEIVCQKV